MPRTPQQRAQRAAVADASVGDGHEPPDLLLRTPLKPVEPCPQCKTPTEQGRAHICPGGAR